MKKQKSGLPNYRGTLLQGLILLLGIGVISAPSSYSQTPGTKRWEFTTGGAVLSSPAIGADGTVYIGSVSQEVYALDGITGSKRWGFMTGAAVESPPVIGVDGTVYIGSHDGHLYALEGKTGAKLWEFNLGGWVSSQAIGAEGTIYVGSNKGITYALDGKTGAKRWESNTSCGFGPPAVGADGTVYVGSGDGIYALNGNTGTQRWKFITRGAVETSPAIDADGTVYIGSNDKNVYALDGSTGVKRWEFMTGGDVYASPSIGNNGMVYVGSHDNKVYALDGKTGTKRWEFTTGDKVGSSPAIGIDGTVYIGSNDKNVYALDGNTGTKRWEYLTGDWVGAPAICSDGTVYIGSGDRKIYALWSSSVGGLANSAWPMLQKNVRHSGQLDQLQQIQRILTLTGDGDYMVIPSANDLQPADQITIEAWIYPFNNTNNPNAFFISKGCGPNMDSPRTYELSWTPDNRAYFSMFAGESTWCLLAAPVAKNRWTHIAAAFNGTDGRFTLYTNGILAASTTNDVSGQFPLKGQKLRQTSLPLVLGCSFNGSPLPETYATGQMDEVRIWNRALSGQEILQGISLRLSGSESNLVAYWNFDNGTPNDLSSNRHNGTLMDHASIVPMGGIDIIHDVIGFSSASFSRRGEIILGFAVRNGVTFQIDASTNLVDWVAINTIQNAESPVQFTDPDTLKFNQRFYRAVTTPRTVQIDPTGTGSTIVLTIGDLLEVVLNENPSTGYRWELTIGQTNIVQQVGEPLFVSSNPGVPGASGKVTFRLKAVADGQATLTFNLIPPGAPAPAETLEFQVVVK